jgi:uncharacterized membrane protein YhaH (DUF805 family)
MATFFHRLSAIQNYRWASVALIAAMILLPVLMMRLGALEWVASLAGLPVYVALVVLTYRRLRDANLSGWWIVLMILVVNLGPRGDGLEPITFYVSHLIYLIPVALGWLAPAPGNVVVQSSQRSRKNLFLGARTAVGIACVALLFFGPVRQLMEGGSPSQMLWAFLWVVVGVALVVMINWLLDKPSSG